MSPTMLGCRLILPLLVVSCLAGCDEDTVRKGTAAPLERRPVVAPAEPPVEADDEAVEIGWGVLREPSKIAQRRNRDALHRHEEGQLTEALAGFEEAIAEAPGYAIARYNRACALARLDRLEEAATVLEALAAEDLPTVRDRLARDSDLAGLRDGSEGDRLRHLLEELTPRYRGALARGVPALSFYPRAFDEAGITSGATRRPHSALRAGVYDPVTRRFVPMSPRVGATLGALVDRERDLAIVVTGRLNIGTCWTFYPEARTAHVFDLGVPGTRLFEVRVPRDPEALEYLSLRARARRDGVQFTFEGPSLARGFRESYEARPATTRAIREDVAAGDGALLICGQGHGRGCSLSPPLEGYRVRGRELAIGERTIELIHRYPRASMQLSPDGKRLYVQSVRSNCSSDTPASPYRAELVDLDASTSSPLATGSTLPGPPHALWGRFAADGTLFLQLGAEVVRYAPGSTTPVRDVPSGVFLISQLQGEGEPVCDC